MSSQAFFWVNVGLGLFLVLIFLVGKRGIVAPSKLNLKKGLKGRGLAKSGAQFKSAQVHSFETEPGVKNLNILFNYNGHTFDAYEVLGAPAGAKFEMIEKFYQDGIQRRGQDREFLEAAFFAIKSSRQQ